MSSAQPVQEAGPVSKWTTTRKNAWTASLLAMLAVPALSGCREGDPIRAADQLPPKLLEVQEQLEAKVAIVLDHHYHPDSVPQWWYSTDTVPMDIDGHEMQLRRVARLRHGLTAAEVDLVMESMRQARRERMRGREIVREEVQGLTRAQQAELRKAFEKARPAR